MPSLPTITQKIVVDVEGDKRAAAAIGETTKALDDQEKVTRKHRDTTDEFIKKQKALLEQELKNERSSGLLTRARRAGVREVQNEVRAEEQNARALARSEAQHNSLLRELKKTSAGFRGLGQVAGLAATAVGLIKFPGLIAGANLATSAIGALGSGVLGLVAALGPMLNLVGLIPAALAGAAGGLGAVLLGTRGVTQAIGLGFAAKKPGAGAQKDPVAEARKQEDAIRGVARAQETLSDSQREAQRAQEDLNKAVLDARNNLRDLREEQTRGTNSVERAQIALARAQEANAQTQADEAATALDKKSALLDVSDAELDLLDAQEKRTQNARDLADAEAKGVQGSNEVVDATERVSDAQQAVTDNTLELKRAIEDVGRALKDSGTTPTQKFTDSLKDLGPESRKFVNTIVGASGTFKNLKRDIGEGIFGPINESMTGVLANAPAFSTFLVKSGEGIGAIGKALGEAFGDQGFGEDLKTLGAGNKSLFESIAKGIKPLVKIFTDLAVAGQPFVKEIVDLAVGGLQKFSDKINDLRNNGGLESFFRRGLDVAKQFGSILRDAFVGIGGVLRAAKPLGDDLLKSFGDIIKRFRDFTQSFTGQTTMQTYFANQHGVLTETAKLIGAIGKQFFELSSKNAKPLADTLARIRIEGLPIIRQLFDSVGPGFIDRLLDLAIAFGKMSASLFGDSGSLKIFLGVLTRIFDVIGALTSHPIVKALILDLITLAATFRALALVAKVTGLKGFYDLLSSPVGKRIIKAFIDGIGSLVSNLTNLRGGGEAAAEGLKTASGAADAAAGSAAAAATAEADMAASFDAVAGSSGAAAGGVESVGAASGTAAGEAEGLGGAAGTAAGEVEGLGATSGTAAAEVEALGTVSGTAAGEVEALGGAAGTSAAGIEAEGGAAATSAAETEALGVASATAAPEVGAVGGAAGEAAVGVEALGVASATTAVEEDAAAASSVGLLASLGPLALIIGTIAGTVFVVTSLWKEWHRRGKELKGSINDVKDALKDTNATIDEAVQKATEKRVADKHQVDDLARAGVTTKEIAQNAVDAGKSIEDIRAKLVASGEQGFQAPFGLNDPGKIAEAKQEYIRTGKVIDGFILTNQGLDDTINDIAKASQEAAKQTIELGRANGSITPDLAGAAIQYDLQNQGILGFLTNGPNMVTQLGFIEGKQKDVADATKRANDEAQRTIDLEKAKVAGPLAISGATRDESKAGRDAIKAAGDAAAAQKKVNDLAAAGKSNTDEGRKAQQDLTDANDAAAEAADRYAQSSLDLANAQAAANGETLTSQQVVDAQRGAFERLSAFIAPGSTLSAYIDGLQSDLDNVFKDREMTVNVTWSGTTDAFTTIASNLAAAVKNGFTSGLTGLLNLPATIAGLATPKGPYPGGAASPWSKPKDSTIIVSTRTGAREAGGLIGLAGGGMTPVGSGFMTNGPIAVVGEGKAQFPEFVIPTDPTHRGNAWRLLLDLLQHIGAPKFEGGGLLNNDFSGLRVMAGSLDMGGTRQVTTGTSIVGDTIGTSIGNELNFHEGAIVVKDWDAAKAQIARDQRLRNLTRTRSARSG